MHTLITVLHIIAALFLILVVLLQTGKGAAMGSMIGGGASETMFGSSGAGNFLTKLTTGAAIVFMCTSLTLATLSKDGNSDSVINEVEQSAPATPSPDKDSE